jgi:hypothetical protein
MLWSSNERLEYDLGDFFRSFKVVAVPGVSRIEGFTADSWRLSRAGDAGGEL